MLSSVIVSVLNFSAVEILNVFDFISEEKAFTFLLTVYWVGLLEPSNSAITTSVGSNELEKLKSTGLSTKKKVWDESVDLNVALELIDAAVPQFGLNLFHKFYD